MWAHLGKIEAAIATADGRWSASTQISSSERGAVGVTPDLAVDARGDALAVWAEKSLDYVPIVRAAYRPAGGQFGPAVDVSPRNAVYGVLSPKVALSSNGRSAVVWEQDVSGVNTAVEGTVGSVNAWQPPAQLSSPGLWAQGAHVAMNARGEAMAGWAEAALPIGAQSAKRVQVAASQPGGGFGPAVTLDADPRVLFGDPRSGASLGVTTGGTAVAVWSRLINERYFATFVAVQSQAGGTWRTQPCLVPALRTPPTFAFDPSGSGLLAWGQPTGSRTVIRARTIALPSGTPGPAEAVARGSGGSVVLSAYAGRAPVVGFGLRELGAQLVYSTRPAG
ncbi:MAG: hypothetical protein QOJ97_1994 [Solirubrobacteraceae bacterium]|nr:hypothetical protein [Solirubrobacteraceae bacterium]